MSRLTYPLLIAGAIVVAAAIVIFGAQFVLARRGENRFWRRLVVTAMALLGLGVGAMGINGCSSTAKDPGSVQKQADLRGTYERLGQRYTELKKMYEKGAMPGTPAYDKAAEMVRSDSNALRTGLKNDRENVTGAGLKPEEVEKLCANVDKLLGEIKNQPVVMCYEPAAVRPIEAYDFRKGYERLQVQYDMLVEMRANGAVKGDAYNKVVISIHDDLTKIEEAIKNDPAAVEEAGLNKDDAQKLCKDVEALLNKINTEK